MALGDWRYNFVADPTARNLLDSEAAGFAIDATDYDTYVPAKYVGGPVGGSMGRKGGTMHARMNVALDHAADLHKGASILTQAGTSAKMVHFPASPYVRWTPHNRCLQSQTLGTTWSASDVTISANATTAPDGTSTADTIVSTAANTYQFIHQTSLGQLSGAIYTFSVYAKPAGYNFIEIGSHTGVGSYTTYAFRSFNVSTGTSLTSRSNSSTILSTSITYAGNGWYRCSITYLTGGAEDSVDIRISSDDSMGDVDNLNGSDGVYIWGAQLNRGSITTPYLVTTTTARIGIPLGYDNAASQYGILVEPAATNIVTYSEDLSNYWTNNASSESTNSTTAPNGTATADTLIEDNTNDRHMIYNSSLTATNGVTYCLSCYAKAKERSYVALTLASTTDKFGAVFFLSGAGSVTDTNSTSAPLGTSSAITSIGDGWYRIAITLTADGTAMAPHLCLSNSATPSWSLSSPTYAGDNTSGAYFWGAQLETGSVATSYIPTVGGTATRAADLMTVTFAAFPYSAIAGTIYSGATVRNMSDFASKWYIGDGTLNEFIANYKEQAGGGDDDYFDVIDGGATQSQLNASAAWSVNTELQATCAWAANTFGLSVNGGGIVGPDTSGTLPTVTVFEVGTIDQGYQLNGFLYRLAYVPRRVVDGDLPTWRYEA